MKAQMCFDSNNIGGGGVFRANGSSSITPANSSGGSSRTPNEDGVIGDGSSNNGKGGKVRKCKRARRIKRKSHNHANRHQHFDQDNREMRGEMIKEYLCKLQEIVPFSRKDKRLSKLEVITNAIDYIRELRETLGMPPCISSSDSISHFSSETNDLIFSQQLPSLSASLQSSMPAFYSLIPDDNSREEKSQSPVESTTDNCCSHFSPDHHHHSKLEDRVQDGWGIVRPALWAISVPCSGEEDSSSNSDNNSDTFSSSMISSSALSSDKVNT